MLTAKARLHKLSRAVNLDNSDVKTGYFNNSYFKLVIMLSMFHN